MTQFKRDRIICKRCRKVVGYSYDTGRREHGYKVIESKYTHATWKEIHPFPNKEITMKDIFCDYCGREVH